VPLSQLHLSDEGGERDEPATITFTIVARTSTRPAVRPFLNPEVAHATLASDISKVSGSWRWIWLGVRHDLRFGDLKWVAHLCPGRASRHNKTSTCA